MSTGTDERREAFEAWASLPPREWCLERQGPNGVWPGQYHSYAVQCAWEAWKATPLP